MSIGFFARVLLVFCAFIPLHADVIYTNFGTGDAYAAGSGLIVTHDRAAWSSVAIAFTPEATYSLASIEFVASTLFAGDGATLNLFADDNGHPDDTPLESFLLNSLGQFGGPVPLVTVNSLLQPVLQASTVYWVGLNANAGGMIVWNQNSSGAAGAASTDGAGHWALSDSPQGAVQIDGVLLPVVPVITPLVLQTTNTSAAPDSPDSQPVVVVNQDDEIPDFVPEPATSCLTASALIAFALLLRRQKRTCLAHQK